MITIIHIINIIIAITVTVYNNNSGGYALSS